MRASRRTSVREAVYGQQGLRLPMLTRFVGIDFSPVLLDPAIWYDFADLSTVVTSSGLITNVANKGSLGADLMSAGANRPALAPLAMNGLHAAEWPSGDNAQYLYTNAAVSGSPVIREVYVALRYANAGGFSNYDGIFGEQNNSANPPLIADAGGPGLYGGMFNANYLNGSGTTASTVDRTSNVFPEISANCILRSTSTTGCPLDAGVTVGMDRNYSGLNRGWSGLIGEILGFFLPLPVANRNALVTLMRNKWGAP